MRVIKKISALMAKGLAVGLLTAVLFSFTLIFIPAGASAHTTSGSTAIINWDSFLITLAPDPDTSMTLSWTFQDDYTYAYAYNDTAGSSYMDGHPVARWGKVYLQVQTHPVPTVMHMHMQAAGVISRLPVQVISPFL